MEKVDGDFLRRLLEKDSEFRRIYEAHRDYEKRVAKLGKKIYVTKEEAIEEKRLKKMKLEHKDRMEEIVNRLRV
ncbi:MAG TPA: DUF465 domain-containing protein [Thermodesulfobacteriota bacterium]|nr:DUF465 domain-containing protein [Thermodesulfobacteriota bacterium]